MRKILGVLLPVVILFALPIQAKPVDELKRLATEEALPEVRQAAVLALSQVWEGSELSDVGLRQLALEAPAPELRGAAARALGLRQVQSVTGADALIGLVLEGEFEEIRVVAANALAQTLPQEALGLDTLLSMLDEANIPLLQQAFAPVLSRALAASPKDIRSLLAQAAAPASPALRQALAQAAFEKLQVSTLFPVDEATLFPVAAGQQRMVPGHIQGHTPELRSAAAQVYGRLLAQTAPAVPALEALVGDPARSAEVRTAAAPLLSQAWLNANLTLSALEQRASGPTPQFQDAAVEALVQAYVGAIGRLELTRQALADSVSSAQSQALARARAEALFVLLRSALVAPEAQADLERIVNGQTVTVRGVVVDGSLQAFRQVAGNFLTGIYTFFGFIDRLENPLENLTAIATDTTLSPEFRQAAADALQVVFSADRQRSLQTLDGLRQLLEALWQALDPLDLEAASASLEGFRQRLAQALELLVVTAEVAGDFSLRQTLTGDLNRSLATIEQALQQGRLLTVRTEISKVQRQLDAAQRSLEAAPPVTTEDLIAFAGNGSTSQLQQAAAAALVQRLLRDEVPFDRLWQLAQQGASPALQLATVAALAQAWSADPDTLYAFSQTGATAAVRQAASVALARCAELSGLQLQD